MAVFVNVSVSVQTVLRRVLYMILLMILCDYDIEEPNSGLNLEFLLELVNTILMFPNKGFHTTALVLYACFPLL